MERKQNSYNLHRMTQERIHTNTMYSKAVCLASEVEIHVLFRKQVLQFNSTKNMLDIILWALSSSRWGNIN